MLKNKADVIFKDNILKVLEEGVWDKNPRPIYESDGSPAHTKYITQVFEEYDLNQGEFPITLLRPIHWKKGIGEMLWIYKDQTSELDVLEEKYGIDWWEQWRIESTNNIGRRYGDTVRRYDLINNLLKGIKENKYGRRHIVNLWQEADLQTYAKLPPCAYEVAFMVRTIDGIDYLDATLSQRSSDALVSSHINMIQYVALQMMVAHECNMKVGKFARLTHNYHIYSRHMNQAQELLDRNPLPSINKPELILEAGDKSFYEIEVNDFKLINYHPIKPQLTFDLGI